MFKTTAPTKGLRDLLKELGGYPYEIKTIDFENVIYRDLRNGFDIEVSGADNNRKIRNVRYTVYVWLTKYAVHTVETISDIRSIDQLKAILKTVSDKYLAADAGEVYRTMFPG